MIEVFKTDVVSITDAARLVIKLEQAFGACRFNFDLDDCDHILRAHAVTGMPDILGIINLLSAEGFDAYVLPDDTSIDQGEISFQSYRYKENLQASIKSSPRWM
jgi:hypothetical protein